MEDWRDRLDRELKERRIKKTHLSVELGFSRDYISRLLKKGSNPNIANLQKVCDAIGASFIKIYTGRDVEPIYDQVVEKISKLTETELEGLRDHLERQPLTSEKKG